ncbi:MAG: TIGR02996 domain-containing protein, partial [Planctomycetaceae bacterium]|nr:TIGR02996 domain-containing protein [Planctomycetaceae bacterium]
MTTEQKLFEAILQNPDDITLRLIFADWCDERSDPRGEFIRVQCELAESDSSDGAIPSLRRREAELLHQHRREWNGEFHRRLIGTPLQNRVRGRRGAVRRWEYQRGFIEYLEIEATALLQDSETLFQIGPINSLRIVQGARILDKVLRCPVLQRMKS